jgi:hypothetical protein
MSHQALLNRRFIKKLSVNFDVSERCLNDSGQPARTERDSALDVLDVLDCAKFDVAHAC